jgi:hypothetical protein
MEPLISVITPVYNRRQTIVRAVSSVAAQHYGRFEHIVVDDGSDDGTADLLDGMNLPGLRVIRLGGRFGANHARNAGIKASAGDIITFLDSDDEFLPLRLRHSRAVLDANPDFNLMISSFRTVRGNKLTESTNKFLRLNAVELERQLVAQTLFEALGRLQDRDLLMKLSRTEGALIRPEVDWIKHQCADSISSQSRGYAFAYAELMARHPVIASNYPDIAKYMIARHLLSSTFKGRFLVMIEDLNVCRSRPEFGWSLRELADGYMAGKRQRKAIRGEQTWVGVPATRDTRPAGQAA